MRSASRKTSLWLRLLGACGLGALVAARAAEQTEDFGPFTVVTHTVGHLGGWNEGRLYRSSSDHYSVRFRGLDFQFSGRVDDYSDDTQIYGDWFNSVISAAANPQVLVVNVGDPNNTSFFYLLREVQGQAQAELLTMARGGVAASMLDATPATGPRDTSLHRRHFESGSLLQLGDDCIIDLGGLSVHRYSRPDYPDANPFARPLGLSPDRRSMVQIGSPHDGRYQLLVTDFVADRLRRIDIDRQQMRFYSWEQIDQRWFEHYFHWQADADGIDQLQARDGVNPLPHQGNLSVAAGSSPQYTLKPALPGLYPALIAFLIEEYAAEALPFDTDQVEQALASNNAFVNRQLRIHGELINVSYGSHGVASVSLWPEHGADLQLLQQLARRVDEELRGGAFDALFSATDLPWPESDHSLPAFLPEFPQ